MPRNVNALQAFLRGGSFCSFSPAAWKPLKGPSGNPPTINALQIGSTLTTATLAAPTTDGFESFARCVSGETVNRADVVAAFHELEAPETFGALVLAFDTLVKAVHTDGLTPRSIALISALDEISIRFMSGPTWSAEMSGA